MIGDDDRSGYLSWVLSVCFGVVGVEVRDLCSSLGDPVEAGAVKDGARAQTTGSLDEEPSPFRMFVTNIERLETLDD